jgi:hypothetical protein
MSTQTGKEEKTHEEEKWGVKWFLQDGTNRNIKWSRPKEKPALHGYVTEAEWIAIPEAVRNRLEYRLPPVTPPSVPQIEDVALKRKPASLPEKTNSVTPPIVEPTGKKTLKRKSSPPLSNKKKKNKTTSQLELKSRIIKLEDIPKSSRGFRMSDIIVDKDDEEEEKEEELWDKEMLKRCLLNVKQ